MHWIKPQHHNVRARQVIHTVEYLLVASNYTTKEEHRVCTNANSDRLDYYMHNGLRNKKLTCKGKVVNYGEKNYAAELSPQVTFVPNCKSVLSLFTGTGTDACVALLNRCDAFCVDNNQHQIAMAVQKFDAFVARFTSTVDLLFHRQECLDLSASYARMIWKMGDPKILPFLAKYIEELPSIIKAGKDEAKKLKKQKKQLLTDVEVVEETEVETCTSVAEEPLVEVVPESVPVADPDDSQATCFAPDVEPLEENDFAREARERDEITRAAAASLEDIVP